ncbi:MAG: sulfatase-like hydrolase/transferase [Lentisphaerae bacterium]|nr:sulfatase-like hydrolase/transferase [Lentisphaerota bacterium]
MNVLLILGDALRRDHMGCFGYSKNTTPTIDRLVSEGVMFRNCASSSSHTVPPTLSALTGQDTITHGIMTAQDYAPWIRDDPWRERQIPLRVLARNGYCVDGDLVKRFAPAGFTQDHLDVEAYLEEHRDTRWFYFAQPYPTHLPYDPPQEYYDKFIEPDYAPTPESRARLDIVKHAMICHPTGTTAALETDQDEAIPDDEMDEDHARTSAVADLEQEDAPGIRALYDGEMRVFDDWVATHLQKLESLGLLEDTLIVLMSDHGEELMERGHVGHSSTNLNGTLYDESMMVPLIMWHASCLPRGRVVKPLVSVMDVMPTIFDVLGMQLAEPIDGRSLLPLMKSEDYTPRDTVFAEVPPAGWQRLIGDERRIRAARTTDWKLVCSMDLTRPEKRYELYDLRSDPGELNDLYASDHQQAVALTEKLEAHFGG